MIIYAVSEDVSSTSLEQFDAENCTVQVDSRVSIVIVSCIVFTVTITLHDCIQLCQVNVTGFHWRHLISQELLLH